MIKQRLWRILVLLVPALFVIVSACKQKDHLREIVLSKAWVRPAAGMSAAYLRVENFTTRPDYLESASSPAAGRVELHQTINDNHVMKMRPVKTLRIDAGSKQDLAPGGLHLMLMDLKRELKSGDTVKLLLKFRGAGVKTVQARVKIHGRL